MAKEKDYKEGTPRSQGFYKVKTADGNKHIAEWRERDKKAGKQWWVYKNTTPTEEKHPVLLTSTVTSYRTATELEVKESLARELTKDENIAASLKTYREDRALYNPFSMPPPVSRQLQIGQAVLLGNLQDVKVIALHDGGEVVTVEYRSIRREQGKVIDQGTAYRSCYWLDVIPRTQGHPSGLAHIPAHRIQSYFSTCIGELVRRMYKTGVNDSPEYQREYVWTREDKDHFLDSLFTGRDIGRFIFVRQQHPASDVLFDGKQRMNTLLELISSQLPYQGVYWHEMAFMDRHTVLDRSVQYADLNGAQYSRAQLLEIFLDVNIAGVPQTEEHVAKVRRLLEEERAQEHAIQAKKGIR